MPRSFSRASISPLRLPSGRSTWVGIAGDDHLGIMPQAGQKHQHLRRRRVLSLVENDDAVIQRSARA